MLAALLPGNLGTSPACAAPAVAIVSPENPSPVEDLAAREVRRILYQRTGEWLPIVPRLPDGNAIAVANSAHAVELSSSNPCANAALQPQDFLLRSVDSSPPARQVWLVGGSDAATLYAVYRFAEHLGVRFYLDGDVFPDQQIPLALPRLDEKRAPLFDLRGVQPFHDFPEGPDWWNVEDYQAIIAQLPKLGMNFFGLHTYPLVEPTVWIGQPADIAADGKVSFSYPTRYYNTALTVGWGYNAKRTSDYACGAAALYDRDDYGADVMRGLTPQPANADQSNAMFERTAGMFNTAFTLARSLGVKTCIGTETPLVVPPGVAQRVLGRQTQGLIADGGQSAAHPSPVADTEDGPLYQSVRYNLKGYRCELPNGRYAVILRFSEIAYDRPGVRVFGVNLEGQPPQPCQDHLAKVGKNRALDFTFEDVQVDDGRLDIDFVPQVEFPCIAAVEVSGHGQSWKVNCAGPAYKDYQGEDGDALSPEQLGKVYEGIFTRIVQSHPLDYYWFWTPESWTWADVSEETALRTINDLNVAHAAWDRVKPPFQLATCGWVLGPQYNRALLGEALPADFSVSCINRAVGHDPVEPGFANVQGRGKWAIPWLEDDPAMTSLQLWAGRMRRDARDARDYGCTGLMGIHWRTRILRPNVAALAQAAWEQGADDFYPAWALSEFGPEIAADAATLLGEVDGKLPRPSDWIGGPGGYAPDKRPWPEVLAEYAFVDRYAALHDRVQGPGHLERFDYWLNNMRFLRATGQMRCLWNEFNETFAAVKTEADAAVKAQRVRDEALPRWTTLLRTVEEAYGYLLATVDTAGELGTVCNFEQHTFPTLIDAPSRELTEAHGAPLPDEAQLRRTYEGPARLIVPTRRALVNRGDDLVIRAIVLDRAPGSQVTVHWRKLGTKEFKHSLDLAPVRQTYSAIITANDINGDDIEYYVEAKTADSKTLVWPPTAPKINQAVVQQ
jgi:hypothetical protein